MENTNSFKFVMLFFTGQQTANAFEGDFKTKIAVPVIKHKSSDTCFVYLNKEVHFLLPETNLDKKDIEGETYTVSDVQKVHSVVVNINDENSVEVHSTFPVGTTFTHIGVLDFYSLAGSIFLATEPLKI